MSFKCNKSLWKGEQKNYNLYLSNVESIFFVKYKAYVHNLNWWIYTYNKNADICMHV